METTLNGYTIEHTGMIAADSNIGRHHTILPKENYFNYHAIVEYDDKYYDSSYGISYGIGDAGIANMVHSLSFEYIDEWGYYDYRPGIDGDENWVEVKNFIL